MPAVRRGLHRLSVKGDGDLGKIFVRGVAVQPAHADHRNDQDGPEHQHQPADQAAAHVACSVGDREGIFTPVAVPAVPIIVGRICRLLRPGQDLLHRDLHRPGDLRHPGLLGFIGGSSLLIRGLFLRRAGFGRGRFLRSLHRPGRRRLGRLGIFRLRGALPVLFRLLCRGAAGFLFAQLLRRERGFFRCGGLVRRFCRGRCPGVRRCLRFGFRLFLRFGPGLLPVFVLSCGRAAGTALAGGFAPLAPPAGTAGAAGFFLVLSRLRPFGRLSRIAGSLPALSRLCRGAGLVRSLLCGILLLFFAHTLPP